MFSTDDYCELFLAGKPVPVRMKGVFCGRVLRGTDPSDFQTLTDDPNRKIIMTMGPKGLFALVGRSGHDVLVEIGYERDYIARKVAEGNQFKLVVFTSKGQAWRATWGNVFSLVADAYPEIARIILHPNTSDLEYVSFEEIERDAGYAFSEVDKNGLSDPRFMTAERLLASRCELFQVRAFLYHTVYLRELFTGDGWTRTLEGGRGVREYMMPNALIDDLNDVRVIDLDVQLPR